VLPEGIEPSTLIIMIITAGNDHDLLDLWVMGPEIIEGKRVHMSPYSVLVKIVFKTTGFRAFFNIQAGGGGKCPPVSPCAPPTKSYFAPQEKSLFPKIKQTNQRRKTNR
jgi:hypothetical protein